MCPKKTADTIPIGKCKDCVYSYDPHSPSLTGELTLARCKFEKWSVVLNRRCENRKFKPKR